MSQLEQYDGLVSRNQISFFFLKWVNTHYSTKQQHHDETGMTDHLFSGQPCAGVRCIIDKQGQTTVVQATGTQIRPKHVKTNN